MKRLGTLVGCLMALASHAQVNPNLLGNNQVESGNLIASGSYTAYENTPFIPTDWSKGSVTGTSGKAYEIERIRYNAFEGRPEYEWKGQTYTFSIAVMEFALDVNGTPTVFRSGFKPVDGQTERSFYEVRHDGKTKLLRYRTAKLMDVTQYNSATKQKRFDFPESYYLARPDGTLVRLKRDKKSLLDALPDRAPQLESFITAQKLRFRDWDDVAKVLAHYDQL
jgi:hypothetical protein